MEDLRKCCKCLRTRPRSRNRYRRRTWVDQLETEVIEEPNVENIQTIETSVENIEEAGFGGYENRIQVCEDEDLPPSYARISYYPKVESDEAMKEPPPYRDSMRRGRDVNGVRVTIDTVSEAVHGRTITHTIRNNSTSATIM